MLAGIMLVPALAWLDVAREVIVFGVAVALFLVFTHRKNIRAMLDGSEYRFERVRLRNWIRRDS
jgi:glycerol-3-phosphate acyltransferase PlsY